MSSSLSTNFVHWAQKKYPDGEMKILFAEALSLAVPPSPLFVLHTFTPPMDQSLMELLFVLDLLRQRGYPKPTLILPYFAFGRQNNASVQGDIPAKTVAHLLEACGIARLVTVDWHNESLRDLFTVEVTNLDPTPLFVNDIHQHNLADNNVIIAPDIGSSERAKTLACALNLPVVILEKKRGSNGNPFMTGLAPEVLGSQIFGKTCLLVDDIVDSGRTLCQAAALLQSHGATRCIAYVTHGLFSDGSLARLRANFIDEVVVTNIVPLESDQTAYVRQLSWIDVVNLEEQTIPATHQTAAFLSQCRLRR